MGSQINTIADDSIRPKKVKGLRRKRGASADVTERVTVNITTENAGGLTGTLTDNHVPQANGDGTLSDSRVEIQPDGTVLVAGDAADANPAVTAGSLTSGHTETGVEGRSHGGFGVRGRTVDGEALRGDATGSGYGGRFQTTGTGIAFEGRIINGSNSQPAVNGATSGTGNAVKGLITNTASNAAGIQGNTNGAGAGVAGAGTNTGSLGGLFEQTNAGATVPALRATSLNPAMSAIDCPGGLARKWVVKNNASHTIDGSEGYIYVHSLNALRDVNLISGLPAGTEIVIKGDGSTGTNMLRVLGAGGGASPLIDGGAQYSVMVAWVWYRIVTDGTDWYVVGSA